MKKIRLCLLVWLCCQASLRAQFYISPGAQVAFEGFALVTVNNLDFHNNGALSTGTSILYCSGPSHQTIESGGATLYHLYLDKPSGREVRLGDEMRVAHKIAWMVPGARLVLGKFNLFLGPDATLTDYGNDAYVVTNNIGYLVKEDLDENTFLFPVSAGDGAYNPMNVNELGAPDHIGVRCLAEALDAGFDGSPLHQDAVAAAWDVVEAVPGQSKLTLQVSWTGADELPGFDRDNCGFAQYDPSNGWMLDAGSLEAAGGTDPYFRSQSPLAPGLYMIADKDFTQFADPSPVAMRNAPRESAEPGAISFSLYPNPASEAVFLEIASLPAATESITVRIFDAGGRQVLKQQMKTDTGQVFRLDVSVADLPAGFYRVQVESPQGLPGRGSFFRL